MIVQTNHREHHDVQPWIEFSDPGKLVLQPLVSVCMITYNHEEYIAEAIEGVLSQDTHHPYELVVAEDCSTDETRKIVFEYLRNYPDRIRMITSASNVGMRENFRRCFYAARGKYCAICEGDDFWHAPSKLEKQVAVLEADPSLPLVFSDIHVVINDRRQVESDYLTKSLRGRHFVTYDELVTFQAPMPPTPTVVMRREIVTSVLSRSVECMDYSLLIADHPLFLGLAQYGRFQYVPEKLASYRLSPNSATRKTTTEWTSRLLIEDCEIRLKFLSRYPLAAGPLAMLQWQASLLRRQLPAAATFGDHSVALAARTRLERTGYELSTKEKILVLISGLPIWRRVTLPLFRIIRAAVWRPNDFPLCEPDERWVLKRRKRA